LSFWAQRRIPFIPHSG